MTEPIYGTVNGLDLDNLEATTKEEIDTFLTNSRSERGPLDPGPQYDMRANSVWLYTRPDFAKLHRRVINSWNNDLGLDPIITSSSFTNLHSYINQGWEIGIENCTRGLQRRGVTRAQLMEVVMHAQLSAGIRGLELVSRALGIILGDYVERPEPATFPAGWAPDMEAFYCGLDDSTRELTDQDRKNIEAWHERTLGHVPKRIALLARHDPAFLKNDRRRWENTFKGALPKQMMPYLSIRHNVVIGNKTGLREAVLLGQAWGMGDDYIANTLFQSAYYFTGTEQLDFVEEAVGDLL